MILHDSLAALMSDDHILSIGDSRNETRRPHSGTWLNTTFTFDSGLVQFDSSILCCADIISRVGAGFSCLLPPEFSIVEGLMVLLVTHCTMLSAVSLAKNFLSHSTRTQSVVDFDGCYPSSSVPTRLLVKPISAKKVLPTISYFVLCTSCHYQSLTTP